MTKTTKVAPIEQHRSVITEMASRFNMERAAFEATLKKTVIPADTSNEQMAAFLIVAKEYDLNPFTKEIFGFPARSGGIQPIVSIDGWLKIINSRPEFDGMEFEDRLDDQDGLISVTCRIYRKDRERPTEVTEYMEECRRDTDTWKKWPARMLRHKATIQCARYAFGFSGIYDPDEAARFDDVIDVTPARPKPKALDSSPAFATPEQIDLILAKCQAGKVETADLCAHFSVRAIGELPFDSVNDALAWISEQEVPFE